MLQRAAKEQHGVLKYFTEMGQSIYYELYVKRYSQFTAL